jgi:hypothetical protein
VIESVKNGSIDKSDLTIILKLKKEVAYLADRQTMKASAIEKSRWKNISKYAKELQKSKKY